LLELLVRDYDVEIAVVVEVEQPDAVVVAVGGPHGLAAQQVLIESFMGLAECKKLDPAADHLYVEATAHRFDLRELGHDYPTVLPTEFADSASHACSAAACSAIFFERPSPAPHDTPLMCTSAKKRLA